MIQPEHAIDASEHQHRHKDSSSDRTDVSSAVPSPVATVVVTNLDGEIEDLAQIKKLVVAAFRPRTADRIFEIGRMTNKSFGGFMVGKLIDSLIIGLISYFK